LIPIFLVVSLTVVIGGVSAQTNGDEVTLNSSKDNSLFENVTGALSNGSGSFFFTGQNGFTGGRLNRRGMIAFDVASLFRPSQLSILFHWT